MDNSEERPYWLHPITDAAWANHIRADYPDAAADLSDDAIRDEYADGYKYADTWDHLGDARHDYEQLADAYLALLARSGLPAQAPQE